MKRRKHRLLDTEERILWHSVARTVAPLKGKGLEPASEPLPGSPDQEGKAPLLLDAAAPPADLPPARAGRRHASPPQTQPPKPDRLGLDRPTQVKIARGRLGIDATVDLHGLTQAEAHDLLLSFLHRASASGKRHVLIVTGKGLSAGGEGVLRRAVPGWFSTAAFRGLVSGFDQAARHHGGGGALYVRLRKKPVR